MSLLTNSTKDELLSVLKGGNHGLFSTETSENVKMTSSVERRLSRPKLALAGCSPQHPHGREPMTTWKSGSSKTSCLLLASPGLRHTHDGTYTDIQEEHSCL